MYVCKYNLLNEVTPKQLGEVPHCEQNHVAWIVFSGASVNRPFQGVVLLVAVAAGVVTTTIVENQRFSPKKVSVWVCMALFLCVLSSLVLQRSFPRLAAADFVVW